MNRNATVSLLLVTSRSECTRYRTVPNHLQCWKFHKFRDINCYTKKKSRTCRFKIKLIQEGTCTGKTIRRSKIIRLKIKGVPLKNHPTSYEGTVTQDQRKMTAHQPHLVLVPGLKLVALNLVCDGGAEAVHTLVPPALGPPRRQETGLSLLVRAVLVRPLLPLDNPQSCHQFLSGEGTELANR